MTDRRPMLLPLLLVALILALGVLTIQRLRSLPVPSRGLDDYARRYVVLALAMGQHSPQDIDAYFGDPVLRPDGTRAKSSLAELQRKTHELADELRATSDTADTDRRQRLHAKLVQLGALLELLQRPRGDSFAREAQKVFGLNVPPAAPESARLAIATLNSLLPGSASLADRVQNYRDGFRLPADRRKVVFEAALAECKRRTSSHWPLPTDELLTLEWTRHTDAAWHRYEGQHRSRLQVNPDALTYEEAAIDLACHEGYPGHHTQFLLLEQRYAPKALPLEETVVLLRSADSARREGAAELGIQLAFPLADRVAFERDVLFPLAGLPPSQAKRHVEIMQWINEASSAIAPILAQYRDGQLSATDAAARLRSEAVVSNPAGLLAFVDQYGAYAAGYTVARNTLRQTLLNSNAEDQLQGWQKLQQLITEVITP